MVPSLSLRSLRRVLLSLAIAAPVGAPGATQLLSGSTDSWPYLEDVRVALTTVEAREERLAVLPVAAAPTLWAVLSGQVLSEEPIERALVEEVFEGCAARWPHEELVPRLVRAPEYGTQLSERLTLIEMLGSLQTDAALVAVFDVLAETPPVHLRSRHVPLALERALTDLLADRRRYRTLSDTLSEMPPHLLPLVADAVASFEDPETIALFARIAELDDDLELKVLENLARLARLPLHGRRHDCIDLAREFVNSYDAMERRLAVTALGRLRDNASFEELISLLEDPDPAVQRAALGALQELSGIGRRWDILRWRRWEESERAWLRSARAFEDDLARGEPYEASRAVHHLSIHPVLAEELVPLLGAGLDNQHESVRVRVCEGLARLAHPACVPELIRALDDASDDVRFAAQSALVTLTGAEPGATSRAWDDWWNSL